MHMLSTQCWACNESQILIGYIQRCWSCGFAFDGSQLYFWIRFGSRGVVNLDEVIMGVKVHNRKLKMRLRKEI